MDAVSTGAEVAESPSAAVAEAQPTTGQAPTQPEQSGQPQERMVPLSALIAERRQRQAVEQRIQQLEQRREQTGQPVSDEERELKEARDAFYGKVAPELKDVPQMLQGMAQERFVSSGERMIENFAKTHGLDAGALSNSLADIIKNDPALMARAQRGDVAIVAQYLQGLAPVVAAMKKQGADAQRNAAQTVGQSKTALSKLPPRVTGGVPGGVALPKPVAGDTASQRAATSARHGLMRQMVDEMTG